MNRIEVTNRDATSSGMLVVLNDDDRWSRWKLSVALANENDHVKVTRPSEQWRRASGKSARKVKRYF